MEIRIKILSRSELEEATKLRRYLIPLHQVGYEQPVKFGQLEININEESAEGPSWQRVEVTR